MVSVVTWAQMAWIIGGVCGVGVLLFGINRSQNKSISERLARSEEGLAAAVKELAKVIGNFQLEVAKERASNAYVEEVKKSVDKETDHLWSVVNALRDKVSHLQAERIHS